MELESFVCELDKKIAEHEAILKQKDVALKGALKKLREEQLRWKLHQKNRTHVKNKANYVDFKEYKASLKVREKAKADLDEALFKVATLKSDVKHFKGKIEEAQADRKKIKAELAEYGQVIAFRRTA
jgi:chromosome segregation ATPase